MNPKLKNLLFAIGGTLVLFESIFIIGFVMTWIMDTFGYKTFLFIFCAISFIVIVLCIYNDLNKKDKLW